MYLPTNLFASMAVFLACIDMGNLPRYCITLTDSLPWGIYEEVQVPLARGVIVSECLPLELAQLGKERGWLDRGACPGGVAAVLKQIAGMPGDTVELGEWYVAVNGVLILNTATQKRDRKGRAMPAIARGSFVLGPDEVFLLATNSEGSWDGRYYGPVKIANLITTWKPRFTEAK